MYDLSPAILSSLGLISFDDTLQEVASFDDLNAGTTGSASAEDAKERSTVKFQRCTTCGTDFGDQVNNREHYKNELHTYNIKRHLNGLPPVTEEEFATMLNKLKSNGEVHSESDSEDNISEDETSRSDHQSEAASNEIYDKRDDYLGSLIEEEMDKFSLENNSNEENKSSVSHLNTRSAQIFFNSTFLDVSEAFALYKSLFNKQTITKPLNTIKKWNEIDDQSMELSALFMIGGGHFAGAIVSHNRANVSGNSKKSGENFQEQAVRFLEHKTFHRYTTRRKQGGSQSAMDQAKGKANSAGSSLRRYNEAALKTDIQNLLKLWEPYLSKCQNIFLRAHNSAERNIFTGNPLIGMKRENLKSFPFTTGRPTITELKRCWCELTYLKPSAKPTPLQMKKESSVSESISSKESGKAARQSSIKKPPVEEVHTEELLSLLKKGKAPLLMAYLRKHKLNGDFKLMPENQYSATPTMLHYAAQNGLKQMITILMTNMKCNPCIQNAVGKTAVDLAKDTQIKQSFQISRHLLGENYVNWNDSHIGKPLSREEVQDMNKLEEERRNSEIAAAVKEELENAKRKQKAGVKNKEVSGRPLEAKPVYPNQNLNSLSDEQRRKLMREQRARAAEARMQKS